MTTADSGIGVGVLCEVPRRYVVLASQSRSYEHGYGDQRRRERFKPTHFIFSISVRVLCADGEAIDRSKGPSHHIDFKHARGRRMLAVSARRAFLKNKCEQFAWLRAPLNMTPERSAKRLVTGLCRHAQPKTACPLHPARQTLELAASTSAMGQHRKWLVPLGGTVERP